MRRAVSTWITGAVAVVAAILSIVVLLSKEGRVTRETIRAGATPATVFRPHGGAPGPAVVIAHGFAGSQQLMQSFALSLAHSGYAAVTFDFAGHGRNSAPMTGDITREDGATVTLVAETLRMIAAARELGDGRVAILGHSMASDIIVRAATQDPGIAATVAVSMFSPAVTAQAPRNLLVIAGGWEGMLKDEALRAVGLSAGGVVRERVTYGSFADGTARRAVFIPNTEHVSVLFRAEAMREAVAWLDATFETPRSGALDVAERGPWIALLLAALALLARPFAALLPQVTSQPAGAGLGWRQLWLPLLIPMIVTPLLLRVLPTHFLPVLVADYLTLHFALYGVLTALCLYAVTPASNSPLRSDVLSARFALAVLALLGFTALAVFWPIDRFVTNFWPGEGRTLLLWAMLAGTLPFFLSDEWLTRGLGSARGAYAASKLAFLVSLGIAVALDFERLFFLAIIVPVIVLFFVFFGLISAWVYRSTNHPWVAGLTNAAAIAWAIGVTFPMLAG